MELQADLYAWLQSLGVVADSEIKSRSPTSVLLTPESTRQFESALKLPTLVYRLHALRAAQSPDDSDTNIPALCPLKDSASPLDRLHNWAEVARSLAVHGIILTEEARKRIVSGNLQVVAELLRKIKTAETVLASGQAGRALAENVLSFQDAGSERKTDREMMESKEKPAKREEEENKNRVVVVPRDDPGGAEKQSGPMYVLDIEPTKELGETKTCLEFFLLSLSKCFGLTPSQAAGLLADSNRYLSRILVRGVNKDYSNVTRWLMMLRENAGSFCSLIVAEEGAGAIPMALGTLKGGLFSKDQRTALETCLTLQAVCEELRPYHDQIMKWMLDEGLKAVSELLHLHRGSATVVCEMLISIGATHLKELVTHKLLACCGTSYWELVWELLRQLSPVRSREEMRDIVEFWANEAVKVALSHGCDLRTSAISLLAELWLDFGEAAGDQRAILEVLVKAGSESNNQALQVFAISQLFRILDEFAMEKNPYAPVVYRSLSGLLSETCGEASMREFMMLNFQSFFEANRMAPIDILLVPYLTREEQEPPEWNTFDLEFFERVVGSSKLGERSAFAILEHCARSVMNSFPMAKATALLVLPLLYRLRGHRAAWDFILRTTKTIVALVGNPASPPNTKVVCNRLFRFQPTQPARFRGMDPVSLSHCCIIISLLSDLQTLASSSEIQSSLKSLLLSAHAQIKCAIGRNFEPMYPLFRFYNDADPEAVLMEHESAALNDACEFSESSAADAPPSERALVPCLLQESSVSPAVGESSQDPETCGENQLAICVPPGQLAMVSVKSGSKSQSPSTMKGRGGTSGSRLRLVRPIPRSVYYASDELSRKASLDINKIRLKRRTSNLQKQREKSAAQLRESRRWRLIQFQLEKRRIEHGVSRLNQKDKPMEESEIVMPEGYLDVISQDEPKLREVKLVDLESEEEERESLAISLYLKKYKRLFRNLFDSYSNTCYTARKSQFDDLVQRYEQITLGEITKMLKEHDVTESTISKDAVASLVRLINVKSQRSDLHSLTRKGFLDFFVQMALAVHPAESPLVNAVQKMVERFRAADEANGKSAILYRNPDATTLGDPDVLSELNKAVIKNPTQPVPVGYTKVTEQTVNFGYSVKPAAGVSEALKICVELLDEVMTKALGETHFLESVSEVRSRVKVCPLVLRPQKNRLPPRFMESPVVAPSKMRSTSEAESRVSLLSGTREQFLQGRMLSPKRTKLSPAIKLGIALLPGELRQTGVEVGAVMQEILRAVETGSSSIGNKARTESSISPDANRSTLSISKKTRLFSEADGISPEKEKEMAERRILRKQIIQRQIEEVKLNCEALEAKKREEKDRQQKLAAFMAKKKKAAEREMEEKRKQVAEKRLEREEDERKAKEEREQKLRLEESKKAKARAAFLKHQKDSIERMLRETEERRKLEVESITVASRLMSGQKQRSQQRLVRKLRSEKADRDRAKRLRGELAEFMNGSDMRALMERYGRQLEHIFNYYVKSGDTAAAEKITMAARAMQLQCFVKLATEFRMVPVLVSPEELKVLYTHLIRNKEVDKDERLRSLSFGDFLEGLVRISILAKTKLGKAAGNRSVLDPTGPKLLPQISSLDMEEVNAGLMENLLRYMGVSEGMNRWQLDTLLKRVREEVHVLPSKLARAETIEDLKKRSQSNVG